VKQFLVALVAEHERDSLRIPRARLEDALALPASRLRAPEETLSNAVVLCCVGASLNIREGVGPRGSMQRAATQRTMLSSGHDRISSTTSAAGTLERR
jgi:hypothetical protein